MGEPPFPPLLAEAAWRRAGAAFGWTPREGQIAWCLCVGLGYAAIRSRLGIRHSTLRTHLKSLYRKAGQRGRVRLILGLVHRFR